MKLKRINENNYYLSSQMLRFTRVFKKLNGKASEVATAAVTSNKGVSTGKENDGGRGDNYGWSPEDIRKRRLMAFVKGIQVKGAGISGVIAGAVTEFEINVDTFDYDNLTFDLHRVSPNGIAVAVEMGHEMRELEEHVKITYGVDKPGQYEMDIKYLGISVPCSPFHIDVRHLSDGRANAKDVVAHGKGLKKCMTGEISTFQLETKKAGQGQISVAIDGIKDMPLCVTESKVGYTIQYVATAIGVFFMRIKLDGKHIPGSPFLINAEKRKELPDKSLFKRGVQVGSKERKSDLQP